MKLSDRLVEYISACFTGLWVVSHEHEDALATSDSSAILTLVNFHRFLQNPEVVQAVARQIALGKQNRTFLVVLSPVIQIPTELEKQFIVVEHDLPGSRLPRQARRGTSV